MNQTAWFVRHPGDHDYISDPDPIREYILNRSQELQTVNPSRGIFRTMTVEEYDKGCQCDVPLKNPFNLRFPNVCDKCHLWIPSQPVRILNRASAGDAIVTRVPPPGQVRPRTAPTPDDSVMRYSSWCGTCVSTRDEDKSNTSSKSPSVALPVNHKRSDPCSSDPPGSPVTPPPRDLSPARICPDAPKRQKSTVIPNHPSDRNAHGELWRKMMSIVFGHNYRRDRDEPLPVDRELVSLPQVNFHSECGTCSGLRQEALNKIGLLADICRPRHADRLDDDTKVGQLLIQKAFFTLRYVDPLSKRFLPTEYPMAAYTRAMERWCNFTQSMSSSSLVSESKAIADFFDTFLNSL